MSDDWDLVPLQRAFADWQISREDEQVTARRGDQVFRDPSPAVIDFRLRCIRDDAEAAGASPKTWEQ